MKALAIVLAVAFAALAVAYWTGAAQFGTSRPGPHHTHAILFLILAALALLWLRFQPSQAGSRAR